MWVRIPLETYIFILNFSLPPRSEQVNGAVANEIKHVHSPEVIVVLDPRYDLSNKALYISTCSIALSGLGSYPMCRYAMSKRGALFSFLPRQKLLRTFPIFCDAFSLIHICVMIYKIDLLNLLYWLNFWLNF